MKVRLEVDVISASTDQPRARGAVPALALALTLLIAPGHGHAQSYEILAARYATVDDFPLRSLIPDAPAADTIDIAMAIWVVRDSSRVILFDSGFFREEWLDRFNVRNFERPDRVLARIGIDPDDVTDIVVSHAHWDHMGGIALFPAATIWIQNEEFRYYTGEAWQPGGGRGGIDRADILHLIERNMAGSVRLIRGDSVTILPGITVFTGARHTFASQYMMVEGPVRFVLASDNAYLYRNIEEVRAGATFSREDREANLTALRRMIAMVGDRERVIPGHDAEVFLRFPVVADGVVRIFP
ncbi:MAG: N-acyl homoserine lactonase family protein [Gemmatimonadetes bacterium]|nr:N-acyl homoserine lactonase family protein [Gemmatimonadota bacterium]